ncbi:unnamed protein product [Ostreobium quekettii]|uniref:Uncharacterized protein n=1 Tax=Ostreobium quekettii TaxID=121088 RepID=A0A8S1IQA6_9CHLO|nr:unnamed protein product [Ostreobium quekettii]
MESAAKAKTASKPARVPRVAMLAKPPPRQVCTDRTKEWNNDINVDVRNDKVGSVGPKGSQKHGAPVEESTKKRKRAEQGMTPRPPAGAMSAAAKSAKKMEVQAPAQPKEGDGQAGRAMEAAEVVSNVVMTGKEAKGNAGDVAPGANGSGSGGADGCPTCVFTTKLKFPKGATDEAKIGAMKKCIQDMRVAGVSLGQRVEAREKTIELLEAHLQEAKEQLQAVQGSLRETQAGFREAQAYVNGDGSASDLQRGED